MLTNAEFDADFKSIKKSVKKFLQKKLLAQKCTKYVLFQLLVLRTKVLSPVTFFVYSTLFATFSTDSNGGFIKGILRGSGVLNR